MGNIDLTDALEVSFAIITISCQQPWHGADSVGSQWGHILGKWWQR
jgi:hypothetical protein